MYDQNGTPMARRAADPNNEPVKFVTGLDASGFLNGVVNLTFVTARFSAGTVMHQPGDIAGDIAVSEDSIVASRLRMDLHAAQELYRVLGDILEKNTVKPAGEKAN